ncbi:hypothetical protein [Candidatus Odyssella thessalonicensis]|uniref:hypothetical protein n=1 Tax=Candidatus Odyssella thessalonicensis TaxID=84647 RepID=UPI000225AF6C|nr:hypothetical protein [Candidatus Odyssella thessalonicensis]
MKTLLLLGSLLSPALFAFSSATAVETPTYIPSMAASSQQISPLHNATLMLSSDLDLSFLNVYSRQNVLRLLTDFVDGRVDYIVKFFMDKPLTALHRYHQIINNLQTSPALRDPFSKTEIWGKLATVFALTDCSDPLRQQLQLARAGLTYWAASQPEQAKIFFDKVAAKPINEEVLYTLVLFNHATGNLEECVRFGHLLARKDAFKKQQYYAAAQAYLNACFSVTDLTGTIDGEDAYDIRYQVLGEKALRKQILPLVLHHYSLSELESVVSLLENVMPENHLKRYLYEELRYSVAKPFMDSLVHKYKEAQELAITKQLKELKDKLEECCANPFAPLELLVDLTAVNLWLDLKEPSLRILYELKQHMSDKNAFDVFRTLELTDKEFKKQQFILELKKLQPKIHQVSLHQAQIEAKASPILKQEFSNYLAVAADILLPEETILSLLMHTREINILPQQSTLPVLKVEDTSEEATKSTSRKKRGKRNKKITSKQPNAQMSGSSKLADSQGFAQQDQSSPREQPQGLNASHSGETNKVDATDQRHQPAGEQLLLNSQSSDKETAPISAEPATASSPQSSTEPPKKGNNRNQRRARKKAALANAAIAARTSINPNEDATAQIAVQEEALLNTAAVDAEKTVEIQGPDKEPTVELSLSNLVDIKSEQESDLSNIAISEEQLTRHHEADVLSHQTEEPGRSSVMSEASQADMQQRSSTQKSAEDVVSESSMVTDLTTAIGTEEVPPSVLEQATKPAIAIEARSQSEGDATPPLLTEFLNLSKEGMFDFFTHLCNKISNIQAEAEQARNQVYQLSVANQVLKNENEQLKRELLNERSLRFRQSSPYYARASQSEHQ